MHNTPIPSAAVVTASSACALESERLNSERIDERFGSWGIEVLQHGSLVRRSSLFSIDGDTRTCWSYAVVQFLEHDSREVADAHAKILSGESIGATFKSAGWKIEKETRHVGAMELPAGGHPISEMMHLSGDERLAVHVYRLILEKAGRTLHYATIVEAHHPDYLVENDLRQLFDWHDNDQPGAEPIDSPLDLVWKSSG